MDKMSFPNLSKQIYKKFPSNIAQKLHRYAQKLNDNNLPIIFNSKHLSYILNIDYSFLHRSIYRTNEHFKYNKFIIPKRSKKIRLIHAPTANTFKIQKFINDYILSKSIPHPCAYAFTTQKSIKDCAMQHCSAKWIFHFDLLDFFYHINEYNVYNIFLNLGYTKKLSFDFARLCTTTYFPAYYNKYFHYPKDSDNVFEPITQKKFYYPYGILPQGAPTSPALSNLAAYSLDNDLEHYAIEKGFTYTRYADDLIFSSYGALSRKSIPTIRNDIIKIINKNHFTEHKEKFKVYAPGSRKIVLGLLVNEDMPKIPKQLYKEIEHKIYIAYKYNIENAAKHFKFDSSYGFYNHLHGYMSYLNNVDKDRFTKLKPRFDSIKPTWQDEFII